MTKRKKLSRLLPLVFGLLLFTIAAGAQQISGYNNSGQLHGTIKVKFKPEIVADPSGLKSIKESNGFTSIGVASVDRLNIQFKAVEMERLFPYSPKHEAKHQKHGLHLWYKVKVESQEQINRIVSAYGQLGEIQVAEPFYQKSLMPHSITELTETIKKGPFVDRDSESPFDDPLFDDQWHYYNTDNNLGTKGADINLLRAWEQQVGTPNVVIAVVDQGVDVEHEDLKANMWVNEAELNGTPGEDSDGNGYIDDIYGYNFVDDSGDIPPLPHGTHVAGTVAATNNNGVGVSGVAGGSGKGDGVRIMSCMIMGEGTSGDAERAYVYSADNGAVISQNSWGYNSPDIKEQSIIDAIDYFVEEAGDFPDSPMQGGVVIFAAGNNGDEGDYWPGCYDRVIAVAATDAHNGVTPYSNYGDWVDISAPGGFVDPGDEYGVLSTMPDNTYGYYDGTSMACPHVSGVAGLIVSEFGGSSFTAEQLTIRLLGGTNVIDTMEINSHYKGKVGVGSTDAYLSLLNDEGIAPDPITDLVSKGESSTMILLNWTVPEDEDDDEPRNFYIYHYDEPITPENKRFVNKVVENSTASVGSLYSYELKQLEANTEYYIVVTGVDRWGNEASLSNQIIVNTNNGPIITLNPEEVSFSINVLQDKTHTESFSIKNDGEGLLSWNVQPRHVENIDDLEDSAERILYTTSNISNVIPEISSSSVIQDGQIQPFEQKPEERYLFHFDADELSATMKVVGDSDERLPNSSATKYHVNNKLGFNLTGVEVGLNFEKAVHEPLYIEILKGDDIYTAEMVHRQILEVPGNALEFEEVKLTQQIYFKQGDVFFIVLHLPPGHRYPFIASQGQNDQSSSYSYFSTDQGVTWKLLPDIYYDPSMVWCTIAMNNLVELDDYITIDKTQGYLYPGEQEVINFTVDADSLINGSYISNLQVYGIGYKEYWEKLKVNFDIKGQKYRMESPSILDYGNVFVGLEKELEISVSNVGLGAFHSGAESSLNISISDDDFSLIGMMPQTIKAERKETLKFRFAPSKPGPINAKVTITEQNGGIHQFNLFGIASMPPKAEINPAEKDYTDLVLGEAFTGFFNLENKGLYPLEYYVPSFADGSNMPDFDDRFVHRFGYVSGVNVPEDSEDSAFEWVDISESGTEIGRGFLKDGSLVFEDALIGFSFPFFGNNYDTCYITNQGAVSFVKQGWFNAKPAGYNSDAQPSKMISAWGMPFDLHISGKIYYEALPGKLIVQYHEVSHGSYFHDENISTGLGWLDEPITFQIVLHQNGDIEYNYKDLGEVIDDQTLGFNRSATLISIEDYDIRDLLVLNGFGTDDEDPQIFGYSPTSGHQVFFKNPGYGSVKELSNAYGTIPVGGSVKLEYTVDTDSLYVGDFQERINIISTDPINNPIIHSININIVSGGEANVIFDQDTVDFGNVFKGAIVSNTLVAGNNGKAIAFLNDMEVEYNRFEIDGYIPVELHPGTFSDYQISFTADALGSVADNILFKTDDGSVLTVPVKANVIKAPLISSGSDKISESLNHGESLKVGVTISNDGENAMQFTPSATEWLNVLPQGQGSYLPGSDYTYTIDYDDNSVFYAPTNVKEIGEKWDGPENPFDPATYWNAFALPFEVPFYGENYDTIYVATNGIITFLPDQEATNTGPIYYIPNEEGVQGFLAPLYSMSGLSSPDYYPETGIYMHAYDDKFVIRYQDISSYGGGSAVSVEVWIFESGIIKYLYDVPEYDNANVLTGIVGLQNQDGTSGIQVSANTKGVIFDKTVVTLLPQETYELDAQSSMELDVILNANSLYGGSYTTDLVFSNNTPLAPEFSIPVSLDIIGEDKVVINDTLELGEIFIVSNPDEESIYPNLYYDFNFTIRNEGSNPLEVDRMYLDHGFNQGIVMGDAKKFGEEGTELEWVDIGTRWINYTIKPLDQETFNLRVMPVNIEDVNDLIKIHCSVDEGLIELPVSASFKNPPVISVDTDKIEVFTNTDDEHHERSFSFKNIGAFDLNYNLEVDYNYEVQASLSVDENSMAASNFFTSANAMPLQTFSNVSANAVAKPMFDKEDFNNVLDHDNAESSEMSVGFGDADWQFCTATKFDAPPAGFNLSHIAVWYNWGSITDSEIEIEIRGESNIFYNTKVLHTTTHRHKVSEATQYGDLVTIELGEELFFYPKEKFYVVVKFPSNVGFPQGVSEVKTAEYDRFFFGDGSAYFDAIDAGYGTMSWIVKAAEYQASENFWVMIDSEKEGTLKVGESAEVELSFASIFAQQGANNAAIAINSNDPVDSTKLVPVTLTRNMGPQYPDGNSVYFSMYEMDTIQYRLRPFDAEGDEFTVKVVEDKPYFTYTQVGNNITFLFGPDYDGEGDHFIEVEGVDVHGNTTMFTMNVTVANVNRAPIVEKEIDEQVFPLQMEEGIYMDFSDYIIDPDGDVLDFEIIYSTTDVLTHAQDKEAGSEVLFFPRRLGDIYINVKVTDPEGAYVTTGFHAFVENRVGVDETDKNRLSIYPNPVTDYLNIQLTGSVLGDTKIQLYNATGQEIIYLERSLHDLYQLDMRDLSTGVYILKITHGDQVSIKKITKR